MVVKMPNQSARLTKHMAMMLTGSGRSPISKALGPTSRRNAIAKTRFASVPTSVGDAIGRAPRLASAGPLQARL
jgi:hypothetical protein